MSLRDLLTETGIQVAREALTSNGMGGSTTTTTMTTLSAAVLWQAGTADRFLSDKIAKSSTHVLVLEPSTYTWTEDDRYVVNGSATYKVTGTPDDVLGYGEIEVVSLERIV